MKLREGTHKKAVNDLVSRLEEKYPNQTIHQDWEYGINNTTLGQVDVWRQNENGTLFFYEVKTGKYKRAQAQKQYENFKFHCPEYNSKGIYYHPIVGVRRLK